MPLDDEIAALWAALPKPATPGQYPCATADGYDYRTATEMLDEIASDTPVPGQTYYLPAD